MSGPSVSAISYRGPIKAPDSKDGSPFLLNLNSVANASSTSSGSAFFYTTVFSCTTFTGLTDFTDAAALYQEFRCLAIEVIFVPADQGAITPFAIASNCSPLFLCPYHGDATALADTGSAFQHVPSTFRSVNQPNKAIVKMIEADEAQWFSTTAGTVPIMGVKTMFNAVTSGATDTVSIGTMLLRSLFQFRGRVRSATQLVTKTPLTIPVEPTPKYSSSDKKDEKESYILVPKSSTKK